MIECGYPNFFSLLDRKAFDRKRGAAALHVDAVTSKILAAEGEADSHRVIERASKAGGVMLAVAVGLTSVQTRGFRQCARLHS